MRFAENESSRVPKASGNNRQRNRYFMELSPGRSLIMLHYWKSPGDNDALDPRNGLGRRDRSHRMLIIILLLRKTNIINGR
ncbi:hypothetical protein TNCT_120721 [Trichonephila clavata]|uniref:Uncharacterized protein n=1 Tax=Trichonephila clavata TaxID=2740835 RepID=A0A8X6FD53_TRICU|nr:hypothetical protein TNCT_120721 [Trichonephila clavata]